MSKLTKVHTGNQDNSFVGCAITGSSDSVASDYVKTVVLSDGDAVSDGMIVVITFSNGNTAGNAPGTKAIYSSDQVNYYEDVGLTIPFTLAPAGCYDLEYTGTGNAYTYQSYPVISIGSVTGPICDYRGHKTSGSLWEGGDEVQCMYKNGKFLLLGGSSASTGDPVGTIIAQYKKSAPAGYLYLDGSTFDSDQYPALYMYLGTNVLPDYREFALVGAEENTTDVYNASTNPTGTIHAHDVYTEGQAKDDQIQNITLRMRTTAGGEGNSIAMTGASAVYDRTINDVSVSGRFGTTTRGKRKAVFFYIKATSGLDENQQENILNTINTNNSYSTIEQPTGAKWIDGKPIYRKVIDFGALPNATEKTVNHNISNLDTLIKMECIAKSASGAMNIPYINISDSSASVSIFYKTTYIAIRTDYDRSAYRATVILEYTKTTD